MNEVILKKIKCQWCEQSFFMCQSCWRGHVYCSLTCRTFGSRETKRKRQYKYRNRPKGRETRRKAERKRGLQQSKKNSGDATSNSTSHVISSPEHQIISTPCCHFCGKKGAIVDQFPRRRYGNRRPIVSNNHISRQGWYHEPQNPEKCTCLSPSS